MFIKFEQGNIIFSFIYFITPTILWLDVLYLICMWRDIFQLENSKGWNTIQSTNVASWFLSCITSICPYYLYSFTWRILTLFEENYKVFFSISFVIYPFLSLIAHVKMVTNLTHDVSTRKCCLLVNLYSGQVNSIFNTHVGLSISNKCKKNMRSIWKNSPQ